MYIFILIYKIITVSEGTGAILQTYFALTYPNILPTVMYRIFYDKQPNIE